MVGVVIYLNLDSYKNMSEVTQSILFRQKLYQNFKQSGLLSQLQTTLRTNLLQKLQKPSLPQPESSQKSHLQALQKNKPLYLRDKFLACIVGEYLKKSRKQYSFSILLPEADLREEDCLGFLEMAEIVNLGEGVIGVEGGDRSFLEVLVQQWTRFRSTEICQRSTQTDYSDPVSKKLQDIQKQYRPKMDYWKLIPASKPTQTSSDLSTIAKQQRMIQQFQLQKKRIRRDLQLSVKAELQKKFTTQYDTKTKQMQKLHEGRLTQLKNRQKAILDSLQRKSKQLEEKARDINQQELKMIKKYEEKILELELEHKRKIKDLENKEKEFWKKELEIKAKKREYQDTIRLVKQKVVEETLNL